MLGRCEDEDVLIEGREGFQRGNMDVAKDRRACVTDQVEMTDGDERGNINIYICICSN